MSGKKDINTPHRGRVERRRISLDASMREGKLKAPKQDIGSVWSDLDKINKREAAERLKRKQQRQLKINQFKSRCKKQIKNIHNVVKNSSLYAFSTRLSKRNKLLSAVFIAVIVVVIFQLNRNTKPTVTSTLGAQDNQLSSNELEEIDKPEFDIMTPNGKSETTMDIRKVNPQGSATSYVFIDSISSITINVSQQLLPDNLQQNSDAGLSKLAEDFQATNIVQIDDSKVYHGYSEKGNRQSILTIKNDLLVLIAVSGKLNDDQIAAYIISLK